MAKLITNQATLNYSSGTDTHTTSSNLATVTLQGPLEILKYSLENSYKIGKEITYNILLTNKTSSTIQNIEIEDDLGTYATTAFTNVTPLTYVGPAKIYIDGLYRSTVTATISPLGDLATFDVGNLNAGENMILQYVAKTNQYAGAIIGTSQIGNIASATATGIRTPIYTTSNIPIGSYADVNIRKTMSPNPVVGLGGLTYTFLISNYGTLAATNIVLTDILATEPSIISVTVDEVPTTNFSYTDGVFLYPASSATTDYDIPAATITRNPATGITTITPSTSTITIQGTI